MDQALSELRAGHFHEARGMFAHAHELLPSARTLRGLGLAEFELRSYVESIDHLKQALESNVRPLTDEQRKETEALLERASRYVTRLALSILPTTASIALDGAPLTGNKGSLLLAAGDHILDVTADDYLAQRRTVHALGGDSQQLTIELTKVAAPVSAAMAPAPREDRSRPLLKNPWLWAGVGVLVGGAVLTASLLATRDSGPAAPYGGNRGTSIKF